MFDWNDEELTNIIWGEADESGDHIVPHQEGNQDCCSKKEWSQETATVKPTEQKTPGAKVNFHERKLESSSNITSDGGISASGSGIDVGSWPELSLSNTTKTSHMLKVSNNVAETTEYSSTSGLEKAEPDKDLENFQNAHEGKEQGDFVDYSWANIGSFDDLDRIFSNDDTIFGNVSLGSADELWSSSKDVTDSPAKSFPDMVEASGLGLGTLRSVSDHLDIKNEHEKEDNQTFTLGFGNVVDSVYTVKNIDYLGDKSKSIVKQQPDVETDEAINALKPRSITENVASTSEDKAYRRKKLSKLRKKPEQIGDTNLSLDFYGTWTPSGNSMGPYENQLPSSMVKSTASSVMGQQSQLQGSETIQYQHFSNPFVPPAAFGNLTNPYSAIPMMSNIQSGELKQQALLSCYDISPSKPSSLNRSAEVAAKPLTMTPQEKIEKLRRRQQMQALLAIQKQQQQFSHQVACRDHLINQKSTSETEIQHIEGADAEDFTNLHSFDPSSPLEQDDSSTISVGINDYSVEDAVLYRVQEITKKLDIKIRLCIRDSLFRLAQSAMQRHYANDARSTNKSNRDENEVANEETKNLSRISDAETETNPIDRTVAHLLFHRPLEKHPEAPESPASAKVSYKRKNGALDVPMGCMPETSKAKQNIPQQGSQSSGPLVDPQHVDQFKNNTCVDTSENASNYGPTEGGATQVEASQ